ncbi:MAG: hypothetical protein HY247_02455 [archaeon]|nr:MAG: hypothetical protein HY247_02455 [archaeon]
MLRPKRRTALVAAASSFAAVYAVLGLVPLSKLVVGAGFLSASKVVAPIGGMVFGPAVGGLAAVVGDFIDVALGRIVLDAFGIPILAADVAIALTAGLAFSGRRVAAVVVPVAALAVYVLDPVSVLLVAGFPFVWFHSVGFVLLGFALLLEKRGALSRLSPFFIGAVALSSELCGQLVGTLVGQTLQVQVYSLLSPDAWAARTSIVFWLYPPERSVFAALSLLVAYPVLKALSRKAPADPRVS